jgi:hypothetical protein
MMPVTRQNAVLDAAPVEREAHMRAAVVEREDAVAVVHDQDRAVATMHDEPAFRLQFIEAACENEFRGRRIRKHARGSKLGRQIGPHSANFMSYASI